MAVAVLVRVKAGSGNVEQMIEVTNRHTRDVADLYRKRFEANYASEGQAWGNDALWLSHSRLCQIIAEGAANTPARNAIKLAARMLRLHGNEPRVPLFRARPPACS